MVELKLDVAQETSSAAAADDCFVSVRVGEFQKLTRLAPSRTYKFPRAADRRFCKLEVFKRIGKVAIDIERQKVSSLDMKLDSNDWGSENLGFKLAVGDTDGKVCKVDEADMVKESQRSKLVKDYLAAHKLEAHIAEAMKQLLFERPENPTEYLGKKLLALGKKAADSNATEQAQKPAPTLSVPAAPIVVLPPVRAPLSAMAGGLGQNFAGGVGSNFVGAAESTPVRVEAAPVPADDARPPTATGIGTQSIESVLPMRHYHQRHFLGGKPMKMARAALYDKFPSKRPPKSSPSDEGGNVSEAVPG
jgi:hypothetical protein